MKLQAVYYRSSDGSEPVAEFIDALDSRRQAVLDAQIERLNLLTDSNPHLPAPYSSQVEGELRELRCHFGSEHYRILYQRSRGLIVLLHIFRKRSAKIPENGKRLAQKRWDDFKRRMDAERRRHPRAIGHDAPGPPRPNI